MAAETLKILVGFPAGSGLDVITRTIAERVRIDTARAIIVDNRGGSGGRIAAEALAKSEPNGNTLLAAPIVTTAFSPFVFKRLGFDPLKDLAPVTRLGTFKFALAVNKDVPVDTRRAVHRLYQGQSGQDELRLPVGRHAVALPGGDVRPIDWHRSQACALSRLGSGDDRAARRRGPSRVQHDRGDAAPHQDKQVKLLAVTGAERSPALPDVPTFGELKIGPGDIEAAELWYGFFAPGSTPTPSSEHAMPSWSKRFAIRTVRDAPEGPSTSTWSIDTPEEFAKIVAADYERWGRIIRETGFTLSE